MGRVVGFSLKVLGTETAIAEIEAVEKRLLLFGEKIKQANAKAQSQSLNIGTSSSKVGAPSAQDTEATKKYIKEQAELIATKKLLREQIQLESQAFLNNAKNIPTDSIIGMRQQVAKLNLELNSLSKEARNGLQGNKLKSDINILKSDINANSEAIGNFQHNVGNYRSAVLGLTSDLKVLQEAGLITQHDLINIFKADSKNRATELQHSIEVLGNEYIELSNSVAKATAEEKKLIQLQLDEKLHKISKAASELNQITAQTRQSGISFSKLKESLAHIGDGLTGGIITGGLFAATAAVVGFGEKAIEKFTEYEKAVIRIDQVVKSTGKSAGFTTEQLKSIGEELGKINNIDNSDVLDKITTPLLKFQNISGAVFTRAQQLIIDFSKNTGKSLEDSTKLIGKALNSPQSASRQLKQLGIALNEEDTKRVKTLYDQNKILDAQVFILDKAEKTFTGQGLAQAASELGQFKAISVQFNNALEHLGGLLFKVGAGVLNFFEDVKNGTVGMSDANKVLGKSWKELSDTVAENSAFISVNFELLKKQGISERERIAVVDQLKAKFPELLDNYKLESAAIKAQQGDLAALSQLQIELTNNAKVQTNEKSKIRTKEQLEIKAFLAEQKAIAAEQAASVKEETNPIVNFFDKIGSKIGNAQLGKLINKQTQVDKEDLAKKLRKEFEEIKKEVENFNDTNENNKAILNIPAIIRTDNTPAQVTALVDKVIQDANKALQSDKTLELNIPGIKDILNNFIGIGTTDFTKQTKEQLNNTAKLANEALRTIDNAAKDMTVHATAEQLAAQKKAADELQKLIEKIADLQDRVKRDQIKLIEDDFERAFQELSIENESVIRKFTDDIEKLQVIANDKTLNQATRDKALEAIGLIKTDIELANSIFSDGIDKNNKLRQRAFEDLSNDLIKVRDEIVSILDKTNADIQANKLQSIEFKINQETRPVGLKLTADTQDLDEKLAQGLISQQKYNKEKLILEKQAANDELDIILKNKEDVLKTLQDQYDADLIALIEADNKAAHEREAATLKEIQDKTDAAKKAGHPELIAEIEKNIRDKARADDLAAETTFQNDEINLLNKHTLAVQSQIDTEREKKSKARGLDTEEEKSHQEEIKQIRLAALDALSSAIDASFEVDNTIAEKRSENEKSRLEKEYSNRLELVKGNAGETNRIEREKNAAIKKLDQDEATRKKKAAINQAIIDGLLAIAKIFAQLGAFAPIPVAAQIIATAILIAKLSATPAFAKGVYLNKQGRGQMTGAGQAPPDESGERPVGTAIIHEDELIWSRRGTTRHPWLANLIDKDQQRLNKGQGSTLESDIVKYFDSRKNVYAKIGNIPQNLIKVMPIPVVIPLNYSAQKQNKLEFTDEHIEILADRISERTAQRTADAIYSGTKAGHKEATLEEIREYSRQQRSGI